MLKNLIFLLLEGKVRESF